jgi:hypothetical protein
MASLNNPQITTYKCKITFQQPLFQPVGPVHDKNNSALCSGRLERR